MSKGNPHNTSDISPVEVIARTLADPDGYITAMEAQGQAELVNSEVLPSIGGHAGPERQEERQKFLALGFTFGDPVPGDDLFQAATIPEGWRREGSDHAMWSYLVDERGVRRVAIFYKAAFYDRKAFMRLANVGDDIATSWIYGDATQPTLNPLLTDEELGQVRDACESYLEDAEAHPDIYGDRAPRAAALIAALPA